MASAASKIRRNASANGIRIGSKPITLRSANGRDMGHAVLVRWLPHNPASSMPGNAYGVDADGVTYYTRSGRGWQRGPIPDAAAGVLADDATA